MLETTASVPPRSVAAARPVAPTANTTIIVGTSDTLAYYVLPPILAAAALRAEGQALPLRGDVRVQRNDAAVGG